MDTAIKNSKQLIEDYVEWLQFMPFSKATVRTYPVYVKSFFKYLKRKERKIKDVRSIDKNVVLRYQTFVQTNSSRKGDVMRRQGFYALKNFFKWLELDDLILRNPLKGVKAPKKESTAVPDVFTLDEIQELLEAPGHADKIAIRDKAILALLYHKAMTGRQLIRLKMTDINLKEDTITVEKSDREDWELSLGEIARDYLIEYRALARPKFMNAASQPWLFLSRKGGQMDEVTITRLVKKYARKIGIKRNVNIRMIREARAVHVTFYSNLPLEQVRVLTGNLSSKSLKRFERLKLREFRNVHSKIDPRKPKKKSS